MTVLGKVPDVAEYLGSATLAVAPMRSGSGIQNKVLEAMSSGAPVVTTSIGNRGVGAQHGLHLLVADTAPDFAHAILSLLSNPQARATQAASARAYVQEHFRWEEHAHKLSQLYQLRSAECGMRNKVRRSVKSEIRIIRNPKLNVMQLTDVTGRGGAEKALADIALHLDRKRYQCIRVRHPERGQLPAAPRPSGHTHLRTGPHKPLGSAPMAQPREAVAPRAGRHPPYSPLRLEHARTHPGQAGGRARDHFARTLVHYLAPRSPR